MLFLVSSMLAGPYFVQHYGKLRAVAAFIAPLAFYMAAAALQLAWHAGKESGFYGF